MDQLALGIIESPPVDLLLRVNSYHDGHGIGAGVKEPIRGRGGHNPELPGQSHGDRAPAIGSAQADVGGEGG